MTESILDFDTIHGKTVTEFRVHGDGGVVTVVVDGACKIERVMEELRDALKCAEAYMDRPMTDYPIEIP